MHISDHLEKYRRFDAAARRLDPATDFVLWYWAISSAGTCLINAALHRVGTLRENRHFATQVPNVYAVPDGPSTWHYEMATGCDLIHAGIPALPAIPPALASAFTAMERIERFRNPCIRADHPVSTGLLLDFAAAYQEVQRETAPFLEEIWP